MEKQDLVIATITWARDEHEEALLRKSLLQLAQLQIPVFVADGGSNKAFADYIKSLPYFTVLQPQEKGLWPQVLTSLQRASEYNTPYILYSEPDKLSFFKQLPLMISNISVDEKTGIVLASRSAAGMSSFPAFQQMTESAINNCCAEAIQQKLDYTYGPFLMNKKLAAYLNKLPIDVGWGWRPYAFNIASRLGFKMNCYEQDFMCPKDQQSDNAAERIYRMKQLIQNIQGLVLSTSGSL